MESGTKNESGRTPSSPETNTKSDKPSFKIKIPFKKSSGKQQISSDNHTLGGITASNTDTLIFHESSDRKRTAESHNPATSLHEAPAASDAPVTNGCIQSAESSQQSMSTTNHTQEDESVVIDVRSTHESKKYEVSQRSTRARSTSFDAREDIKSVNHVTSTMDDKPNRLPLTSMNQSNAQETTFESITSTNRQAHAGSDSKELRESIANTTTSSFLDALNEDERRVRTRHLPAVAGFHRLHKKEVNNDLSMVKNLLKTMAPNPLKNKRVVSDEVGQKYGDKMDVDEDDIMAASDEDNSSDASGAAAKGGSKTSTIMDDSRLEDIASSFSIPYPVSNYVLTELDEIPASFSDYRHLLLRSPQVVESLTTFNPPRPPESVGPKKKQRLTRWEKSPLDIEKDLTNYRKTVRRTKEELQKTIRERERTETVGCFIRSLFMNHLNGMRMESESLAQELNHLQSEAYRFIDGDTRMKTRHKGSTSKVNDAMKDVMSFISSHRKINSFKESGIQSEDRYGMAFTSGTLLPHDWLVRGDRVSTPYGEGTVVRVIGPQVYNEEPVVLSLVAGAGSDAAIFNIFPARVCVRLSYGIAYVSPLIVKPLEHPSTFTADKMAKRWTAMLESASEFSSMGDPIFHSSNGGILVEPEDNVRMAQSTKGSGDGLNDGIQTGLLVNHPIESLFQVLEKVFESDRCVLAQSDNPHIPNPFRESEERRREIQILEGQVLQLRNEVSRQRKLRIATERSLSSNQDRTHRCESLLSEMHADMISLKERLNEDLVELGVDQEKAAEILSDFYSDHFANGSSPSIPRKRKYDGYEHEMEAKSGLFESIHSLSDRFSEHMNQDNEDSVDLEQDERGL